MGDSDASSLSSVVVVRLLVLGGEGCGKTILTHQLRSLCRTGRLTPGNRIPAAPTVGQEIDEYSVPGMAHGGKVSVKEVGGSMMSVWWRFLKDFDALIYVVDRSNPWGLAKCTVELFRVLSSPSTQGIPILLLSNKNTMPSLIPKDAFESALNLEEVKRLPNVTFLEIDAYAGLRMTEVLEWVKKLR